MSDPSRMTTAYKELLARAVMGEQVDLKPAEVRLGNGAYDSPSGSVRPPAEALYEAVPGATYPVTPTRNGAQVNTEVTRAPDSTALSFNEVGVFTASGVMIAHRTLAPQVIASGVALVFRLTLLPPEVF